MSAIFETSDALFKPTALAAKQKATSGLNPAADFAKRLDAALAETDGQGATSPPIAGSSSGMYANVVVNGKVVASLANNGCCVMLDGYSGPEMDAAMAVGGEGPDLAQQRAEAIADILGGSVQKLSSAKTQEQWQSTSGDGQLNDIWALDGTEPAGYDPRGQAEAALALLKSQEEASE